MTSFELRPVIGGWIGTLIFDAVILAAFLYGAVRFARTRADNDARVIDWVRRGIIAVALVAMSLGPTAIEHSSSQAVNKTDVFFAVDITGSMAVDDATNGSTTKETRLAAAKQSIKKLVSMYPGASFAGISFGDSANLGVPPTTDAMAVSSWLSSLDTEPTAVSAGSNLDEPLDMLLTSMQAAHAEDPNAAIVLYYISDGEQTSSQPRRTFASLRQFVDAGAVLGVGSTAGGKVPQITAQQEVTGTAGTSSATNNQWVIDPTTKQPAVSYMDPENLKDIADEISIRYLPINATSTVSKLTPQASPSYLQKVTARKHTERDLLVWPLALLAAALLLWEFTADFIAVRRFL